MNAQFILLIEVILSIIVSVALSGFQVTCNIPNPIQSNTSPVKVSNRHENSRSYDTRVINNRVSFQPQITPAASVTVCYRYRYLFPAIAH